MLSIVAVVAKWEPREDVVEISRFMIDDPDRKPSDSSWFDRSGGE
jgi:hypothetical protein